MNAPELHMLTGAYAMDALPDAEREEFERHLIACPACELEVQELSATAARLGLAVSLVPPPAMKSQVLARAAAVRQEPPWIPGMPRAGGGSRRRTRTVPRFALAACLAAAAALGGAAVLQYRAAQEAQQEARDAERSSQDLARVLAAPDATAGTGELKGGATVTVVVSRREDKAAFLAGRMPEPPAGKVYQLWFADGGKMRPAGLMDSSATTTAMLMDGPLGDATGMGITVEPAGGSKQPTSDPLALMELPRARGA
ncbi:anti-sigma factor [Streptomyces sp. 8N616]|uniref:anti-sigma factor n=1 Tax=Streptomyces sp. 8N616 TaxID=3457414 RepID=UPI003FD5FD6F